MSKNYMFGVTSKNYIYLIPRGDGKPTLTFTKLLNGPYPHINRYQRQTRELILSDMQSASKGRMIKGEKWIDILKLAKEL